MRLTDDDRMDEIRLTDELRDKPLRLNVGPYRRTWADVWTRIKAELDAEAAAEAAEQKERENPCPTVAPD